MGNAFVYGQSSGNAASIEGLVDGATISLSNSSPTSFHILAPVASLKTYTKYVYFASFLDESTENNCALLGSFITQGVFSEHNTQLTSTPASVIMSGPNQALNAAQLQNGNVYGYVQDEVYWIVFQAIMSYAGMVGEPNYFILYEIA